MRGAQSARIAERNRTMALKAISAQSRVLRVLALLSKQRVGEITKAIP